MTGRVVLHIDCDCFFAAVEMREHPEWRAVPLAVGGSPHGRGVISTCNYPARAWGVRSAMPSAMALRLCPSLLLVRGNMELYRHESQRVMDIVRRFARTFEQVSVDEAYLEPLPGLDGYEVAKQIRQQVLAETGLTVSAGVAPNRFLAKIASDLNKPDGLTLIRPQDVAAFMPGLMLARIPGVGPALQERLQAQGARTCVDLQQWSLAQLIHHFGRMGAILYERCRGIDDRPLRPQRERKSISVERTFARDILEPDACLRHLPELMARWRQRLDAAGWQYKNLVPFVKVKFSDFTLTTLSDLQENASADGFERLLRQAMERRQAPVRLLGIGARCQAEAPGQGSLF